MSHPDLPLRPEGVPPSPEARNALLCETVERFRGDILTIVNEAFSSELVDASLRDDYGSVGRHARDMLWSLGVGGGDTTVGLYPGSAELIQLRAGHNVPETAQLPIGVIARLDDGGDRKNGRSVALEHFLEHRRGPQENGSLDPLRVRYLEKLGREKIVEFEVSIHTPHSNPIVREMDEPLDGRVQCVTVHNLHILDGEASVQYPRPFTSAGSLAQLTYPVVAETIQPLGRAVHNMRILNAVMQG